MREEGQSVAAEIEWFVSIDWASQSHQVCLVDARGECLGERAVAHGGAGIEELCDWLIACTGATPEVIGVAIEMTHGPVVEALLNAVFASMGSIPSSSIGSATASPWPAPRACPRESGGRPARRSRAGRQLGHRSARLSAPDERRASDCAAARVVADGRRAAAGTRSSGQPHAWLAKRIVEAGRSLRAVQEL